MIDESSHILKDIKMSDNPDLISPDSEKDLIIINGQNYSPHDIENELGLFSFLKSSNITIVFVRDHDIEREKIALFLKTSKSKVKLRKLLIKINQRLVKKIWAGIESIVPVDHMPKAVNSCERRSILREKYEKREFRNIEVKLPARINVNDKKMEEAVSSREKSSGYLDIRGFTGYLPYAIAEGAVAGKKQIVPPILRTVSRALQNGCLLSPHKGILHVDEAGNERMQTYVELMHSAKRALAGFRDKDLKPGDQVILQIDDSPLFLAAFWGAILGGFIPVPLPVPGGFPISEGMERITKVCSILDRFCIVTDQEKDNYKSLGDTLIIDVKKLLDHEPAKRLHRAKPDDTAILVFSSGSTGDPKGVMLSHKNILSALEAGSMSFIDVAPGDYRPVLGFLFHVIKRKIWKDKGPGIIRRAIHSLSKSSLVNYLNRTKIVSVPMDTMLILSGNKVAPLLELSFDDICLANWMPYSHVLGLIGFHIGPTVNGFPQVTIDTRTFIQNPALFLRLIEKYKISYVPCPNFAVHWLTTQVSEEDIEGLDISCLKMLGNGSEPISPAVTMDFIDKFAKYGLDPKAMCMAYGMSEATVEITFPHMFEKPIFHRVNKDLFSRDKIIQPTDSEENSIELAEVGAPIQCVWIRIVDDDDRLLHENMVGHIQVKGPTVSGGYFNNPEANRNLFCDGWLRTGDMGFMINGRLVISGRQKDIIFVNGQNLFANDIEEQMKKVPGMAYREFAVSGLRHYEEDSEKIIIFIKSTESREALASMLFRVNKAMLTDMGIMIDYLVPVSEIPRTPSAKVKRYKLREQYENNEFTDIVTVDDAAAISRDSEGEEARELTETEKSVVDIWKDVTGVESIGRLDNFFDLGGNSLKATKVASRIQEEFGIDVPLRTIFEHQDVESLSGIIQSMISSGITRKFSPMQPLEPGDFYEVSHAQRRLWYLDKVIPDSPFYNIPAAVLIENITIDINILKKAMQAVVDRQESLRTTFGTVDGRPVQKIASSLKSHIPVIDLSNEKDQEQRLQQIIEEEKFRPFNLEKGPLLRMKVVKLSGTGHAIIIIMHHIISDFWSMGVLLQEALGNYFSFLDGKPSLFPELAIQYRDFSHWQNRLLEGEKINKQEAYWMDNLRGELPALNLPIDRPRPPVQTQKGGTRRMNIETELTNEIKAYARSRNVTSFMLTSAIFKILLHKLTGQDDIIIGCPIANRNYSEIEPLIGFFVNVLPMRSDLSGNPMFTEFLDQVKQTALGAYANQDYPFDKLVEILNPVRDMSRSPVFDVVFEYRESFEDFFAGADIYGASVTNITGDDPMAKFDMFVTLSEGEGNIALQFEYNADLFEEDTIRRMMDYFRNITVQVLASPDKHISEIDILESEERARILKRFNDTARDFPKDRCAHELFEEQARQFPDKEALIFGNDSVNYSRLNEMSNKIARYLRTHGVNRGSYVAIIAERSIEMVAGALGIMKAGGAYVPIEPHYPLIRIKHMLDEIEAPVMIAHKNLIDRLPDYDGHLMCLERFREESEGFDGSNLDNINESDDVAYIIYTSGSTGRPKGVMAPHVGITRLVKNTDYADFTPDDRFLQVATFAFDAATMEFWGPLLNGGSLYLASESDVMSPEALAKLLLDNDITILFITTVMYNQLVDSKPEALAGLKRLLTGGESQSVAHIKKGLKHTKPGVLANIYGPTENTTYSTYYTVNSVPEDAVSIPIGYPIANSTVYILDKYMNPVPVGVPGEIYVGGYGLAKGYLNDPEKTAGAFIKNSIPDIDETILYKTGDLGKWLPDGAVDFIGRVDHQVKIRGHRIELGEIEAVLREQNEIMDSVVIVKNLERGNKTLAAYYVSREDLPIDELRSALRKTLPDYMIPNFFIRLDALPLNRNGKVDRSALPEPGDMRPEMTTEYTVPTDEKESVIAEVWEEALGIKKVGIYDNFFDLGGDSIISLQVVSRLNQKGLALQPMDILMHQTIAELSTVAEETGRVDAEQGPVVGDAALTPIQRWFFDSGLANENHFNQALMFKSSTRLDEDALKSSLQAIVDHHDVLRARYIDGKQKFMAPGQEAFLVVKEPGDDAGLKEEARSLQASFNIAHGPLFGAGLYRMDGMDYLLLAGHHLAVDGVSWRILLEDLLSGYLDALNDREIILPAKTTSFREWTNRLEDYAAGSEISGEASYWEDVILKEMPEIRVDHDTGPNDTGSSEAATLEFNREDTDHLLKDAHRAYNTGVNDLLLTALMRALQGWMGRDEVAFDLEGHGRENVIDTVDISRTVGWFTTIYPVRLCNNRDANVASHIKYVKEALHKVPGKGFNYGVFKYLRGMKWPVSSGISFNYLGQAALPELEDSFSLMSLDVPGTIDDRNERANLVDVICIVTEGRLRVDFIYSRNRHTEKTMEELAGLFKKEISIVISHCLDPVNYDITPSDFDLVELDQTMLDNLSDFE